MSMNVQQAARYVGVTERWLYECIANEKLKATKVNGKWRIRKRDLDDFAGIPEKPQPHDWEDVGEAMVPLKNDIQKLAEEIHELKSLLQRKMYVVIEPECLEDWQDMFLHLDDHDYFEGLGVGRTIDGVCEVVFTSPDKEILIRPSWPNADADFEAMVSFLNKQGLNLEVE